MSFSKFLFQISTIYKGHSDMRFDLIAILQAF